MIVLLFLKTELTMLKIKSSAYILLFLPLLLFSNCSLSQKTNKKKSSEKPDWAISRPVDRNYYHGVGVAMVNTYTQGHVEEAKKKALNDITSEISVTVKSTSLVQVVERNEELNSMYQNLTKVHSENDIEGYELIASWGDEKEYWVYYRLSKELYHRNKQRKLDRAKGVGSQYYESGKSAIQDGNIGRAYEDFVKGLAALKEYIDSEVIIPTEKGQEYLVDVLIYELIELNRNLTISSNVSNLKVRIASEVKDEVGIDVNYNGSPVSIALKPRFTTGSGEVPSSVLSGVNGKAGFKIQRVTGGQNIQVLEISPDIEGMTGESAGEDLMARLIRLKCGVPSAKINIEAKKIAAYFTSDIKVFGEKKPSASMESEIKKLLGEKAFVFTDNKGQAEVSVKLTYEARKGEEFPLKNKTLYTSYVDLFITVTDNSNGQQVYYKGISGEKGSRSGDFDQARLAAEESAMERFKNELLGEIGNLDL